MRKYVRVLYIDRKNPPTPEVIFLLSGFLMKNPEEENPPCRTTPIFFKIGVVLQGGSSSSGFLIREPPNKEPPPVGRVSFDQICVCIYSVYRHICVWVCVSVDMRICVCIRISVHIGILMCGYKCLYI